MGAPSLQSGDYPWAGHPRQFEAALLVQGDPRFGVAGPLVAVQERRGELCREKLLSPGEARALRDTLDRALRGRSPAASPYPFRDHRTLADVDAADREQAEAA